MKSKLFFFHTRRSVPNGAVVLEGSLAQIEEIVARFSQRAVLELYCSRAFITGWKSTLTRDECEIYFLGSWWTEIEKEQGRSRLMPLPLDSRARGGVFGVVAGSIDTSGMRHEPFRPLVPVAAPFIREGGEEFKNWPSRDTTNNRSEYWGKSSIK